MEWTILGFSEEEVRTILRSLLHDKRERANDRAIENRKLMEEIRIKAVIP